MSKVCVIGMWHLGCVTAACLSKWHKVVACDPDPAVIDALSAGKPPIFEPGLQQALSDSEKNGNLSYSKELLKSAEWADYVYFAFDVPVDEEDRSDLSMLIDAFTSIIPAIDSKKTVIISSQVPVGTCRSLAARLESAGKTAAIAYVPENLRLGSAISDFMSPERLVIGASGKDAEKAAQMLFEHVNCRKMSMSLESAEMAKHAMNSYLALLISFSGEISDLCEGSGADARQVMAALLSEPRVSPSAPLMPGLGFGGGTLARDLQSLRAAGKEKGTPTPVLDAAYSANQHRKNYVKDRLRQALGSLSGKTIAFFGLTYKPNTDTLRRSLALEIIGGLKGEAGGIRAYDPAIKTLAGIQGITLCHSAEECAKGADAIVISTAWSEFALLDYGKLCANMRTPVIIDSRNALPSSSIPGKVKYYGVGVSNGV